MEDATALTITIQSFHQKRQDSRIVAPKAAPGDKKRTRLVPEKYGGWTQKELRGPGSLYEIRQRPARDLPIWTT